MVLISSVAAGALAWAAAVEDQPPASTLLSPVFSDSMVLQRAPRSSRLFGRAAPGTVVSVTLAPAPGHPGDVATATAAADGTWVAALPPRPASRGRSISVHASSAGGTPLVSLSDVAFGDVFMCTGQSNMAVEAGNRLMMNQSAELAAASLYDVRLFNNGVMWPPNPKVPNETWLVANATTVRDFSNLCWLTGRDTFRALGGNVTIGLVSSCVGG
jgi:sialate O-acetylesterase